MTKKIKATIIIICILGLLILIGCEERTKCSKYIVHYDNTESYIFGYEYTGDNRTCCCNEHGCLCPSRR